MEIGMLILLALAILVIVLFTLTNGLHDASSVVATFINLWCGHPRTSGTASCYL